MKERTFCKTCKKDVRPIFRWEPGDKLYSIAYNCEICNTDISPLDVNELPFSFDECVEVAKCLEVGKSHPDYTEIDKKIGTIHTCEKCGKMLDITNYCNSECLASETCEPECSCSPCYDTPEKEKEAYLQFEKLSISEAEYKKESVKYDLFELRKKKMLEIVNKIFEKAPPQSDSIFEFDRILWFITEIQLPRSDDIDEAFLDDIEYRFLMDLFILKCTEIGITRLRTESKS